VPVDRLVELQTCGWTPRTFRSAFKWSAQIAGKTTFAIADRKV
jgi:hypothetical protein